MEENTFDDQKRFNLTVMLKREEYVEMRRMLFQHGLSAQEFLSYVIRSMAMQDASIQIIAQSARSAKAASIGQGTIKPVSVTSTALYRLLEQRSPIVK